MRKSLIIVLLFFVFTIIYPVPCYATDGSIRWTKDETAFIEQHPVINIGVDPRFEPIEFITEDGEYRGIAADFIALVSKKTGIQFEVVQDLTWSDVYNMAIEGEIDVMPAVQKTEEREKYFLFSKPYYYTKRVMVMRNTETGISKIKDLEGLTVATIINSSHHSYLSSFPEINLSLYECFEDALAAIADGTEKVFVGNLTVSNYLIKSNALMNLKLVVFEQEQNYSSHFAIRKDWPELGSIINKALDSITQEEKINIKNKWVVDVDIEKDYGPILRVLGIIITIILIVLFVSLFWIKYTERKKAEIEKIEKDLLAQQNNVYAKQLEIISQSQEKLSIVKHDIKNHLISIQILIKHNKLESAVEYIQNTLQEMDNVKEFAKSGNVDIDSILNYKINEAISLGIKVNLDLCIPKKMNFQKYDLVAILGNLIDNAIQATSNLKENKKIDLTIGMKKNVLHIKISNPFNGEHYYVDKNPSPQYIDSNNHGFGLKSIRQSIEKYNGVLDIRQENNIFAVNVFCIIKN